LDLGVSALKKLVETEPDHLLFANRVIPAGFDDGDLVLIKSE